MIRVMANGCFDCLHIGHVRHLRAASALGDMLIVALTVDSHVNKGPGRPVFSWDERAEMLRCLSFVDEVVPAKLGIEAIATYKPDIYVKGEEYLGKDIDELTAAHWNDCRIVFLDTPVYSSTKILNGELLRERIRAAEQSGK